jgi:TPR repeat protein
MLPPPPEKPSGPPVYVLSINGERLEWPDLDSLERDARHDIAAAQFALGQLLLDGEKIPADTDRALVLLEHAAEHGSIDAAYRLADLYTHGRLVVFDEKRGFTYMLMAARGGARTAVYNMGALYANGRGTPQNYTEALAWFTVAEKLGADFGAAARIRDYLKNTAPEQIAIAQQRAAELQRDIDTAAKQRG